MQHIKSVDCITILRSFFVELGKAHYLTVLCLFFNVVIAFQRPINLFFSSTNGLDLLQDPKGIVVNSRFVGPHRPKVTPPFEIVATLIYCNIIANMSRQNKLQLFILIFLTVSLLCHLNIHNAIFYNFYVWRTFRLCAVYTIYTVALMIVFRVSLSCGVQ